MKTIEKIWGKEYWIEVNDSYAMKRLVINEGKSTSLQYHNMKTETLYVIKGTGIVTIGDKWILANENTPVHIPAGVIHKVQAITDMEIIEASTPELEDIVRL